MIQSTAEYSIYSVSELNRTVQTLLVSALPSIWVEGEVSNVRVPASGHVYFSLKDASAHVRCVLFKYRMPFGSLLSNKTFQEGMQILVRAQVNLYEERGDFQLVVEHVEPLGDGVLRQAFELLKQQLFVRGWFEEGRKKPLPTWPKCVGLITSPTGAAIADMLSVLQRRCPALPVIVYPTQVQGAQAAAQIANRIRVANRRKECDVLILARGGGTLEDLWPFNELCVAQAIYDSDIPIVTGVGHEVDFTISDFVADRRAPTPSVAAEVVSPDLAHYHRLLERLTVQLRQAGQNTLKQAQLLVDQFRKRLLLVHPQKKLEQDTQRLDHLTFRLQLMPQFLFQSSKVQMQHFTTRLQYSTPQIQIRDALNRCRELEKALCSSIQSFGQAAQVQLNERIQALEHVSPLNTLKRGYAMVMKGSHMVRKSQDLCLGDTLQIRLGEGEVLCQVLSLDGASDPVRTKDTPE